MIWRKLRRAVVASMLVAGGGTLGEEPRRYAVGMGKVSGIGEARPKRVPAYALPGAAGFAIRAAGAGTLEALGEEGAS